MCGIAGFWGAKGPEAERRQRLERMTAAIGHRGPDGSGCWLGNGVGLGHARLAIIDLACGAQPMWDARGKTVVVFNGEIYNHRELRRELEARGFAFRTHSDTEVIAAALQAWGVNEGLVRLRGMFAFALHDTERQTMILARDRVGIKPLYYARTAHGYLFASEQKALLASGLLAHQVNAVAVHDYLGQGYPVTPASCWAEVQMLEPGTWVEIGPGGLRKQTYWRWQAGADTGESFERATERTQETLHDALRCHLISDVPVAAFLSGGLDSSLSVALLAKGLMPGIQTFTMGFGEGAYDETAAARSVADAFGTDHHEIRMDADAGDPDLFVRIVTQYDEPFGDSSCLPTYMVCREMRKHVKVALSGDGGDEVLGGYVRYLRARQLASLARWRMGAPLVSSLLNGLADATGRAGARLAKAWDYAHQPRAAMLLSLHTYFSEQERLAMYRPEFAQVALAAGPTIERFAPLVPDDEPDPVKQLLAAEFQLRLHADYLRKVDVASSAHGLEVRVPYLDNALCELAMTLPTRYRLGPGGQTKLIARRLADSLLPPGVARAPKKGFGIPLDRWVGPQLHAFLEDLLLDPDARVNKWLRPDAVAGVWRQFAGSREGGLSRFQRYQRAFLLIALELWLRRWEPTL